MNGGTNSGTEERTAEQRNKETGNGGTEQQSNSPYRTEKKDDLTDAIKCILGFHVTSEETKIKNFEFSPSSSKSHF